MMLFYKPKHIHTIIHLYLKVKQDLSLKVHSKMCMTLRRAIFCINRDIFLLQFQILNSKKEWLRFDALSFIYDKNK